MNYHVGEICCKFTETFVIMQFGDMRLCVFIGILDMIVKIPLNSPTLSKALSWSVDALCLSYSIRVDLDEYW